MEDPTAESAAPPPPPPAGDDVEGDMQAVPEVTAASSSSPSKKTIGVANGGSSESGKPLQPPTIITVDTSKTDETNPGGQDSIPAESEGRTPKHANKAPSIDERTEAPERGHEPDSHAHHGAFFPPRPFDGRIGAPTGAFQPHSRNGPQSQMLSLQVSPTSGRYYTSFGAPSYPPGHPAAGYERGMHEYPPRMGYGQQHPSMYQSHYPPPPPGYSQMQPPPPGQHHSGGGWHPGAPPPYASRPPSYPPHMGQYPPPPPPPHHPLPPPQHASMTAGGQNGASTFSRAVSSSFDRSIKSRSSDDRPAPSHHMEREPATSPHFPRNGPPQQDGGSISDDASWKQLNQIQSVDEEEIRKRIANKREPDMENAKRVDVKQSASNSSSLTNSPTDGVEKKPTITEAPKLTSSLDSLSSVASAQEPLKTSTETKVTSPAESHTGSLDLMKCSSGSSALLLPPAHQLSQNGSSLTALAAGSKRSHDEERGDVETTDAEQTKEATESRPSKKGRTETTEEKKSPLSIACSPSAEQDKEKAYQGPGAYPPKESFYDKPLSYSYSLDSVPAMPREGARGEFHHTMARPHSSASSTATPLHISAPDRTAAPSRAGITQLASWEIHAQDSFGGASTGNPLISSFSFSGDYPLLPHSGSTVSEQQSAPPAPPSVPLPRYSDRALESRNQSFEGGHYHGSFSRAETMSFESRGQGMSEPRQGYQGSFPPHAPSWGSAGSYPHPSGYSVPPPHYRMSMQPMVMRSFSQESEPRPGMPHFQTPSDFQAPPSNINRNRQRKETHILTTPYEPSKSGVFGWTKEEDMRLTEIMKKYKNPRDWEPISKELGRNRSAKECHERWIRYLKPGVRKGQWTDQEDAIVMEAVTSSKEQPFTRWSDLAQRLPGRVGKQIRDRWVNHLNPNINHLPFSREDDLLLWEGHQKLGKRWVEIATKYFKGARSENHIKNRWYSASFKKFISNEFGANAYGGSKGGGRSPKKDSKKKSKHSNVSHRDFDEDPTVDAVGV